MRNYNGPTITPAEVAAFTPADILKVYSGKPGCACGCRGQYRYTAASRQDGSAQKDAGQGVQISKSEVNDAQVRKVLKLVQDAVKTKSPAHEIDFASTYVAVDMLDELGHAYRTYTIYPK